MSLLSRNQFLHRALGLAALSLGSVRAHSSSRYTDSNDPEIEPKSIGIYVSVDQTGFEGTFKKIHELGFSHCELYTDQYDVGSADAFKDAARRYNITVHALFTLGPGDTSWDFYEGQNNIGLVSREHRQGRVDALLKLSDFAKAVGVKMIETHAGYIPENPTDPNYKETITALKTVVEYAKKNSQIFLYHAGQESPTTLLRTMEDVGLDNQGVGMDTANLIMYDRGHPFHALDVYGKHVKLVNAKDGLFPTSTRELGKEVQIGQGKVDFPSLIKKLKHIGYKGPVIIEREISDQPQWKLDVVQSCKFLQKLVDLK